MQREEENKNGGYGVKEDHLFEDRYIISDKTVMQSHGMMMTNSQNNY